MSKNRKIITVDIENNKQPPLRKRKPKAKKENVEQGKKEVKEEEGSSKTGEEKEIGEGTTED